MVEITLDKIRGMFLGIAIGDALYAPVETWSAEKIKETYGLLTTYVDPSSHKWMKGHPVGSWTDDTQLTLLVADSLIERRSFEVQDLAKRHVEYWKKEGDLGFGSTTRAAIKRLDSGIHWTESGKSNDPQHGLGNAMPMKVAPLGAFKTSPFFGKRSYNWTLFDSALRDFTLMTHYTNIALESALAHVAAIKFCLEWDGNKKTIIDRFISTIVETCESAPVIKEKFKRQDLLTNRFRTFRHLPFQIMIESDFIEKFGGGTSYVYNSLPFSYGFFLRDPLDIETLYAVGNAGGDTDTNASVVGGLLGALNSASIFPQHLIDGLWQKERILATADRFYKTFFLENSSAPKAMKDREETQ